ncbi:hypothetical protein Q8F55_005631 [Vanrija albida]|uniref:Uncharacterized protein n=1 Tax=Vanrija albida TaxID=181172 RepID=A0ABR3Q2Y5_9TREE
MPEVVWNNDRRYPGPEIHPLPEYITGVPTQPELDAMPRLFTWGELKEMIYTGTLEHLSRNKELQARYEHWMKGQKAQWGSTENYLTRARLPWAPAEAPKTDVAEPTYDQRTALDHPEVDLTPSTNPRAPAPTASGAAAVAAHALQLRTPASNATQTTGNSMAATAASSPVGSGANTPSSVGFVSLESVLPKLKRALRNKCEGEKAGSAEGSSGESTSSSDGHFEDEDDEPDVFLKYDPKLGLEKDKYAVLPNDWPYCVPYGVRHYCVWSRIPIAHPVLVDYDPEAWAKIEDQGLGGFTGVIPVEAEETGGLQTPPPASGPGRSGPAAAGKGGWYAVDVSFGGTEMRKWAGVGFESKGGHEVGQMVKGLWDERGWETIWFVNPPRLQSVPGFSHFHVFARRKTPDEIDVSERAKAAGEEPKL